MNDGLKKAHSRGSSLAGELPATTGGPQKAERQRMKEWLAKRGVPSGWGSRRRADGTQTTRVQIANERRRAAKS